MFTLYIFLLNYVDQYEILNNIIKIRLRIY